MKRRIDHDTAVDAAVYAASAALTASADSCAAAAIAAAAATAAEEALGEIDKAALNGAIVGMLVNADVCVRHAAVVAFFKLDKYGAWLVPMRQVLGRIEPAVLASHTGFIVGMLAHTDASMRSRALDLINFAAIGMRKHAVIAVVCSAVTNTMLMDEKSGLRFSANMTLARLKPLSHWAKARALVDEYRVRPYALFWYEYAGKQLCAPGGKWAVRDCAAFEAEFNDELHPCSGEDGAPHMVCC